MTTTAFQRITIFDLATGAVHSTTSSDIGDEDAHCREGQGWIPGMHERVDPATGEGHPYLEWDLTIETNRLSGIKPGATAYVGLERYEIGEAGEIVFDLALPQIVHVSVTHPLCRPLEDMIAVPCEPLP